MKKLNIWASIFLGLGILIYLFLSLVPCSFYSSDNDCALGAGFSVIYFGFPLIIIGIILFLVSFFMKKKSLK